MTAGRTRIGVVAPSRGIDPASVERVRERVGDRAELIVHSHCFLHHGHFAGTDEERAAAFLEIANDPAIDAIWFARGGYGAMRLLPRLLPALTPAAIGKTYLGYSDTGVLLAALCRMGARVAHGPMLADVRRVGGEVAVMRALDWLTTADEAAIAPGLDDRPHYAFNLVILLSLLATPHLPDLDGAVLMVEEVAEPIYRIDRLFAQLFEAGLLHRLSELRLGRVTDVPPNDPDFGMDEEAVARHWCAAAGIPFGARADIGHDADNRIVPFPRRLP